MKVKGKVAQPCLTLGNPVDHTVHGILRARILECIAFPFSRGSSQTSDQTQVPHIPGGFSTSGAPREVAVCIPASLLGLPLTTPASHPSRSPSS